MSVQVIFDNFPQLTETQRAQFEQLDALYRDWNAKINVISRKDIDNLYGEFQAGETSEGKTPLTSFTEGDAEPKDVFAKGEK